MSSIVYNSFLDDLAGGLVNIASDTFYVMLVTSSYTAAKTHAKRSDVTSEASGTGYTSGGVATTVSKSKDNTNNRLDITFGNVSWSNATVTARGAVIYKHRGGANTADELVAYVDFSQDISSTNAAFAVTFSAPLRFQN